MSCFKKTVCIGILCLVSFKPSPFTTMAITVQEEEKLGQEFIQYVKHSYNVVDDPYIDRYINTLGQKLLKQFPPQLFTFHFYVVEDDVFNAFAGPAGHIFVHSGLIEAMENESELAGILAHEISHVTCRHISRNIDRSGKLQMGTLAGVLAGILLGATGSGEGGMAITAGAMGLGQSVALAYSREDEQQADEVGLKALTQAGYSITGVLTMLKKIRAVDYTGSDIPSYFSTHPALNDRIVYVSRYLETNPPAAGPPPLDADFQRVHTRVLADYGDKLKAEQTFKAMAGKPPVGFLSDYGMSRLAARNGNRDGAETLLKKAIAKQAFDPFLLSELGGYYYGDEKYPEAQKVLESSVAMDPGNPESRLLLGQTKLAMKDFVSAERILTRLAADKPDYAKAFYSLGETYNREGKFADAYYYLGRYYVLTGDRQKAIFNLKRAQKESPPEDLKRKIDATLKDVEKEVKEKKEERDKETGPGERKPSPFSTRSPAAFSRSL